MESLKLYIKESYNELVNKVTWPTWANLQGSTIVVIVASLLLSLIIFLMDSISNGMLSFIYKLNA
ncbi:MAG: preprotein translocase subunit SecE [Saprospirales bacterium]|jgi:preprotein translocase subunit SecE|nr:preprotein translocase subunit SecE [Saprospirales bacterium]MBK6903399.1 preprotein translocase subunit SecE [Saprospirales bacterium]MBK7336766.1 preprotein translocase subunit SecE [Saprospirales bacterium]